MSTESFTCCDNPACSAAVRDEDIGADEWFSATFNADKDGDWIANEDLFPRVDACSLKCLGEAIAAFDYEGFVDGNRPHEAT